MEHEMIGTCNTCSYSKRFKFGGGRLKFQNVCLGPAINTKTGKIETINYKMFDPMVYKIYSDAELQSEHPEYLDKFKYGNFTIYPTGNFCPSCHKKTFDFSIKITVE
jgi:hypothetical protein